MINDPLLSVKISFFYELASLLELFLREFQTDKPMTPFFK